MAQHCDSRLPYLCCCCGRNISQTTPLSHAVVVILFGEATVAFAGDVVNVGCSRCMWRHFVMILKLISPHQLV